MFTQFNMTQLKAWIAFIDGSIKRKYIANHDIKESAITYREITFTWDKNMETLIAMLSYDHDADYYVRVSMIIDSYYKMISMIGSSHGDLKEELHKATEAFKDIRRMWVHPWNLWGRNKAADTANIVMYEKKSFFGTMVICFAKEKFSDDGQVSSEIIEYDMREVIYESVSKIYSLLFNLVLEEL